MPQSMTGFGQAESVHEGFKIAWRLKSVNHRYLDLSLRVPEGMESEELAASALLKTFFRRGHIDGWLTLSMEVISAPPLELNEPLLRRLLSLERVIGEHFDGDGMTRSVLDMGTLMAWPGVVSERRMDMIGRSRESGFKQVILEVLHQAAQALKEVREEEGRRTRLVLMQLLEELQGSMTLVGGRIPELRALLKEKLRARLDDWLATRVDEGRFLQELAVQYNRMDVSEELERLGMHCQEVRKLMSLEEPLGKRLDFLCQELGREANTMCSKSQDGHLSRLGVEMKVTIEKMREQVQNLE
ncbi:MAG: YicC family protein [Magnetococcales bacterium]|nr:YicC family protein [Magnetococcales bacterium]